jgi:F0F1-type ATP synthase delta subunit
MINRQKIKKLAIIAAENKTIPADIEEFVLTQLGKQELKIFLGFYKKALTKKRVYITSSDHVSDEIIKTLKGIYKDKEILTTVDESLGAGMKLTEDDTIIDFTFKKYINDTIEELKN